MTCGRPSETPDADAHSYDLNVTEMSPCVTKEAFGEAGAAVWNGMKAGFHRVRTQWIRGFML